MPEFGQRFARERAVEDVAPTGGGSGEEPAVTRFVRDKKGELLAQFFDPREIHSGRFRRRVQGLAGQFLKQVSTTSPSGTSSRARRELFIKYSRMPQPED